MQSYSDLNLKCCDCESTFLSATKLLQHFAEHVHQENKARFKGSSVPRNRKKKNVGGEVSTSQGESGSESSQTLSVSDSCSESRESASLELTQPCKLAKFDLQKRLETCVSNLATPQETRIVSQLAKKEWNNEGKVDSAPDTKVSEDYSPLKYCMITMEDNDNKSDVISSPKKVASRKQLAPKKIERKFDGFRKLAPKPEGLVLSESSLHSPGKKKYACHLCTKVFGWSTDLKRHILVHTGERPFKCKTCQATFTRNFLLQKHQSKVHPCKPKDIEVKPEIVEMPDYVENHFDEGVKVEVDPLKEEPVYGNDCEDDEDDDRLIITEDIEEKPTLATCSPDTKWHLMSTNAERRCSNLKQSDLFSISPVKV